MRKLFIVGAFVATGAVASAAGIPLDTFDTYANTAALNAAWTVDNAGITLKTDGGHSGSNYIQSIGDGTTIAGRISKAISLTPTDNSPIIVSFWIRASSTAQGRSYIQLEAPSTQLINFGEFNNPAGTGWFARTLGGGAPGAWSSVGSVNRVANTWVHLKIEVKARDVSYYADDTLLATQSRTTSDWPTFNAFRIGFTSSSAVAVDYDDVEVSQTIAASVSDWNLY